MENYSSDTSYSASSSHGHEVGSSPLSNGLSNLNRKNNNRYKKDGMSSVDNEVSSMKNEIGLRNGRGRLDYNVFNDRNNTYNLLRGAENGDVDDDDDDDDDDENDDGIDGDGTDGGIDSSGLTIPKLQESMTPWRSLAGNRIGYKEIGDKSKLDTLSPSNSRASVINSLFSIDGAPTTAPASAGSLEIEQLQKQVTTYRLKIRTLFELIKQLSNVDDTSPDGKRDSFYKNLLKTISQNDEVEELRKQLEDLEISNIGIVDELHAKVDTLNKELTDTKKDHQATLEYVNEYIEHSEQVSNNIDEMLSMLMEKLYKISPEEKDALQKAKDISSSFVMVKMNALISTMRRVLDDLKEYQTQENDSFVIANSTEIKIDDAKSPIETSNLEDKSILDTRLEEAINDIHDEYDKFIHGMKDKVDKSSILEDTLMKKISEQNKLIQKISDLYSTQNTSSKIQRGNDENRSLKFLKESEQQLNKTIDMLNEDILKKDKTITELKYKIENFQEVTSIENKLRKELDEEIKLGKIKEKNWENLADELETDINELEIAKKKLLNIIEQLNVDIEITKRESDDAISQLENQLHSMERKYNIMDIRHKESNSEHDKLIAEIRLLEKEVKKWQEIANDAKSNSINIQKFDSEFNNFKEHLLLHMSNLLETFSKILQESSINQSEKKLQNIYKISGLAKIKLIQPRLESLYNFIETALESVVESYMALLLSENENYEGGNKYIEVNKALELRVEELERKWISERERRKLDSNASEERIQKLEKENEMLRERLFNASMKS
ncbi:hypothetical protein Kpol_1049p5 [Vanderwaltozyma polyspora DSM 70294]|uniref:Mto1-like Mto2p-binding domain-containing protein n=1 Tax=Vanderwaltozyma polyspora (strain ATCC 22028 / DSM 70294 / BCRC 21397 / CBS 2163 / NBRC 10782 / NRRL Y-8283 / UCD 57-17) TaxID=436907 RepID=A7TPP6_VANPO|nr:uncharacterized protein Kpol_1049p5 [Vanderwaltozyma polyspora DSM 70294]EDO15748.1 hypothetical protein Kpol_1049p5 [Vanderwaltozyma polyspora DSM 70294]